MSKISFFTQIKTFVASHLVPVIATSTIVIVGVTAGIVAIVVNSNKQDTEVSVNTSADSPKDNEQENSSEKSDDEEQSQEPTNDEKPTTNTSNTSKPAETTKPNTSQNQTSSNNTSTTQKPNTSNNQTTTHSKPSTSQTQPSQPTTPTTPTQPTTPTEPEKPAVKTDYYYVCVGTTNDSALKAEIQGGIPNAQDFMVYSFERKSPITNCLDEIRKMSVPEVAYKLNWKLNEFDTFDAMLRFEDGLWQ